MDDKRFQGRDLAPQLVAELSHALRTPLTSILVYAWLLADNPRKNLSAEEVGFATGIHRAGSALLHRIDHVLGPPKPAAAFAQYSGPDDHARRTAC